jgi:hypothetical protein
VRGAVDACAVRRMQERERRLATDSQNSSILPSHAHVMRNEVV